MSGPDSRSGPTGAGGQRSQRSHLMDPAVLRANYEQRMRAEHAARAAGREIDTSGETVYLTDRGSRRDAMSLPRVRAFVMSVLVATTLFHFTLGLAVAGFLSDTTPKRVGFNVLAMVTGCFMVASARLVHGKSLLSWWMLLGPVMGIVGLLVVLS